MERRDFIKSLLVAAGVALVPAQVLGATRHWVMLKRIEPQAILLSGWAAGYVIGERNDGRHFWVSFSVQTQGLSNGELLTYEYENAMDTLNTFLDCDCDEDARCSYHDAMFHVGVDE